MTVEILLRRYLTPVQAPPELDERIRKMVEEERLEQRVMGTILSTADGCAGCPNTPYAQEMVSLEGKPVMTCRYISYEMLEGVKARSANTKICVYQSVLFKPYQHKGSFRRIARAIRNGLSRQATDPIGRYECLKFRFKKLSKRTVHDNKRRMRR